jgi:hypothetical protein
MSEPILMPFQDKPFNGDTFICDEFLNLKDKFSITTAIETGSCVYSTTKWLGINFKKVFTVEVNQDFAVWGKNKIEDMPHVEAFIQDSVEFLKALPPKENAIFFLELVSCVCTIAMEVAVSNCSQLCDIPVISWTAEKNG